MDPATAALEAGEGPARNKAYLRRVLMYGFALGCLVWVFHDVHPRRLLDTMTIAHWWFVVLAVLFDVLTYLLQGIRWRLLLSPVGHLSVLRSTQAIYAGLFTNEVVPLRPGELVRAFLVSRWLSLGVSLVVPSMLVERLLDAVWLATGIGLAALFVPLPKNLLRAGDVLGTFVLVSTAIFLWVILRKEKESGAEPDHSTGASGARKGLEMFVSRVAAGLRGIGLSRHLVLPVLLSAGMLGCQSLVVWFMLLACGIRLPLAAGATVLLIVRLGTAIPNAPANVGSFQFFTVLALGLFAVDKSAAAAFSIVYFAALTIPLWLLGLLAISGMGMNLTTIRKEVARLRSSRQHH